ncbi:hypothetical protein DFP72DRAFT_1080829 [Ephemerocybe angulata]|uniref:MULE transposase domain-containing protein n=1 Tax=Ephemerocybe angulata TaxID=980116 RepID=A0A8H6HBI3_9AGAR|nr:hypothetical protein DFP72DRAFT_1080829 [Tulosesus angulatus]
MQQALARLPFGEQSAVPALASISAMRSSSFDPHGPVPKCLRLSDSSLKAMEVHIKNVGLEHHRFTYSVKDQNRAFQLFTQLGVHIPADSERDVQSKMSIQKSDKKSLQNEKTRATRHIQCQCGTDNTAGRHASKKRQMPWKNVGCLVWVKLVTVHEPEHGNMIAIDEISGILDHSEACSNQIEMDRNPTVPLNAELRDHALALLRKHVPVSLLQSECAAWADEKWPSGIPAQELGISQRTSAEENLDKWFRRDKPQPPSPILTESCFHYQAHIKPVSDRFEIIISTPEMKESAWKYGHNQQVLMDLTFGFSSARALLVILLVLNSENTGIPICFIIFTARDTAKATHADYDTQILTDLLERFKKSMGTNNLGEAFNIAVANTDNDEITDHEEARTLYIAEVAFWKQEGRKRDSISKKQAKGALAFLKYFELYLKVKAYWFSWSPAGAIEAARRLRLPIKRIARTNNPLESFNGRIKNKYWQPYQHSGRLPRIDLWVRLTITDIMPDFFEKLKCAKKLENYYHGLRTIQTGDPKPSAQSSTLVAELSFNDSADTLSDSSLTLASGDIAACIQSWIDNLDDEFADVEHPPDVPVEHCAQSNEIIVESHGETVDTSITQLDDEEEVDTLPESPGTDDGKALWTKTRVPGHITLRVTTHREPRIGIAPDSDESESPASDLSAASPPQSASPDSHSPDYSPNLPAGDLPKSESNTSYEQDNCNEITSTIMEIQTVHDRLLELTLRLQALSPSSIDEIDSLLSNDIRRHLDGEIVMGDVLECAPVNVGQFEVGVEHPGDKEMEELDDQVGELVGIQEMRYKNSGIKRAAGSRTIERRRRSLPQAPPEARVEDAPSRRRKPLPEAPPEACVADAPSRRRKGPAGLPEAQGVQGGQGPPGGDGGRAPAVAAGAANTCFPRTSTAQSRHRMDSETHLSPSNNPARRTQTTSTSPQPATARPLGANSANSPNPAYGKTPHTLRLRRKHR